jgi:hypothetical protein
MYRTHIYGLKRERWSIFWKYYLWSFSVSEDIYIVCSDVSWPCNGKKSAEPLPHILQQDFSALPSSRHTNNSTMERLDQGHLNPKLEVPRLAGNQTPASAVGGELSSKSYLNSALTAIRNIYCIYELVTWLPPVHVFTRTYMNTHELHYRM